jgi:hypothetical protein
MYSFQNKVHLLTYDNGLFATEKDILKTHFVAELVDCSK